MDVLMPLYFEKSDNMILEIEIGVIVEKNMHKNVRFGVECIREIAFPEQEVKHRACLRCVSCSLV